MQRGSRPRSSYRSSDTARSLIAALLVALTPVLDAQEGSGFGGRGVRGMRTSNAPTLHCIGFEEFPAGSVLGVLSTPLGPVAIQGFNPDLGPGNTAIVFDSANPTGGDFDLGTPNEDFGGPGIGAAGESGSPFANMQAKGKLLILAENMLDANSDGLIDVPDDADPLGATIELDFAATGPVEIESVFFIDGESDRPASQIELYAPGGALIGVVPIVAPGNNGVINVTLGIVDVERMVFQLNGSTAIDDICLRQFIDCNGNGAQDHEDIDTGDSGDCNRNGLPDDCEPDCDRDGTPDDCEPDCDRDGTPDDCELDCDEDGLPDDCEADCDGDGLPDDCEPDCDQDGTPDDCEPDCDGNGTPDDCEPDCDANGIPDACEPDCDMDGTPDGCEPDCDGDGLPDDCELDEDGNGFPDDCESCPEPENWCDTGCYSLVDGGHGGLYPPGFGLRLDHLFGPGSGPFTFSFMQPGTGAWLCYDEGSGTATVHGIGFGGLDIGATWDPDLASLVEVNFVWSGVYCDGINLIAPSSGAAYGTLEWLETGDVFHLYGQGNQLNQNARLWSYDGTWHGWISYEPGQNSVGVQDWVCFVAPVAQCPPLPDGDGDGTPDTLEPDCDGDGIPDDCEPDADGNGTPDDCERE